MKIIQEIQRWSEKLPRWQQHGIAKLYKSRMLDEKDILDMMALLKADYGMSVLLDFTPCFLTLSDIAESVDSGDFIRLLAIKNLKYVNAIAENQRVPINPSGLTIIYGENGAGKSGYSRVLKRACRARDQREQILPDARKPRESVGVPQATFEISYQGVVEELEWKANSVSDKRLSTISIFDSFCASAYLDEEGDLAYTPDGLDIVEGLAGACYKIKNKLNDEIKSIVIDTRPFWFLESSVTKVGKLISTLSAKTEVQEIIGLASLSFEEENRFKELSRVLAAGDPKEKLNQMIGSAKRISLLINRIEEILLFMSDQKLADIKELAQEWRSAQQTADLATKKFKDQPGLLPGTGEDAWKSLFEAACSFSDQFLHIQYFSHASPDSYCPLCQNAIGHEGSERFISFYQFVKDECETKASTAKQKVLAAVLQFTQASISLGLDEVFYDELKHSFPEIAARLCDFEDAASKRREAVVSAVAPNGSWSSVPELSPDPRGDLEVVRDSMLAGANMFESAIDEKLRQLLLAERDELDARRNLAQLKDMVVSAIVGYKRIEVLKYCVDATNTVAISRKATEISLQLAAKEVLSCLNEELKALCVHELKVGIKTSSVAGKTFYKLVLEIPGGQKPSNILSEGEQRAIALATFLAEVRLSGDMGVLVFDDPVSSLDHRRRWNVAKRIAAESKSRQVIVFTHDIYFLCILQQEVKALGGDMYSQCIRRTPEGFGSPSEKLPFDSLSTQQRVKYLRQLHERVSAAYKAGDEDVHKKLTRDAYCDLRLAWERGVEEVLLNQAVNRFSEGVSTIRLKSVVVDDSDYVAIEGGMTKCSKFAHDAASGVILPTPHPDDLLVDINNLEAWRKAVEARKLIVASGRKL